ncbi:transforming growth factor-beta-induced protein ig-h3-like [Mytilus trossulus]|uniref:transforming growth factor-beta-induced protein ig-h3-like n=1 Tax=Mytilus trossulus TaxID=6551 RepID=UPI0030068ADD
MFRYCCIFLAVHCVLGGNLVEVLQANNNSRLIQYATACGLADTILGGTYTIFAPTDAAFDALGTEKELLSDKTVLTTILLYHLTNGVIRRSDAQNELKVESVAGLKVRFNIYYNKAFLIEGAKISKFDLNATNGIVHVIDKVMVPPTGGIVDLVSGNNDLSIFMALCKRANITGVLQSDPLTVFAPTNAAFDKLSQRISTRIHDDLTILKELLEFHLVPHTEYSPGLFNREQIRTLDLKSELLKLSVSGLRGLNMFRYCCIFLAVHCVLGGNLIEVLQANGESRLIKYATACGLADTILGGTFTIFAPTNAAFDAIGTEQELLSDKTVLTTILLYHLTNGVIRSTDAKNELTVESVAGLKIRFNIYPHNKAVTVEGAKISKFDLNASNGIVHVIDKVLIPPTGEIVDLVSGNKDLGTLLSLVQKANITGIIQRDPLTVFAPTNAAFSRLPANVLSRLNSDTGLLKEVLEYHLVPHTAYSPGLYNREYIRTLDSQKDVIRLSVSGKAVSVNSYGRVIKADIPATNGVVHLIDHVLIPIRYWLSFGFGK